MAIRESMPQPDVETEIVAHPPDEADQTRYRFRFAKLVFVEKLCNGPDRPLSWSLDDAAQKQIAVMIARKRGRGIQVDGLRTRPARKHALVPRYCGYP